MSGSYGPRRASRRPLPEEVSAAVEAAAGKAERSDRHVSMLGLAKLTGWDRGTIRDWIDKKGCPVVSRGGRGEDAVLDVGEVWRWREEQVRQDAIRKAGASGIGEDGDFLGFLGIRDPAKAADAQLKFMKVGVQAGELVPHASMHDVLSQAFGALRNAVMAIPDRLYRDMSGFPDTLKKRWRQDVLGHCRDALATAAKQVERAMAAEADDGPPGA